MTAGRGQLEIQSTEPSWNLLYTPLFLVDFNPYSLADDKL